MAAARSVRKIYDLSFSEIELNLTEGLLLSYVDAYGPTIQSQLADVMGLGSPSIVNLVDTLTERGLVSREPDPADRRVRRVVVTNAGHKLALRVAELDEILARRLRKGLTKADRARIAEMLAIVQRNLDGAMTEF